MSDRDRQDAEKREKIWIFERDYSRRDVLRTAGAAGLAAGLGGLLAACGGGDEGGEAAPATTEAAATTEAGATEDAATTQAAGTPKTGGRLRIGHVGGGEAESFNPARGSSFIDASRFFNLYDPLVRVAPDLSIEPGLAVEWIPSPDATVWDVKLRPDVVWHDGKSFTADDVIYTLRTMADPKHTGHSKVANIKLDELKKTDDLTLQIPLKGPSARLFDSFTLFQTVIVQDGATDFSNPVGTGAFMFDSFTPGERSLCLKNPNYWDEGKPYVDEWEDISITDDAARLNALLAGEIDAMSQLQYAQAKAQQEQGQIQVINAPSSSIQVILMAVDIEPFNDPNVRKAFRLIADRQALVDGALSGFGTVANDLAGQGLPYFAEDLPAREQDIEQAKALLQQAGKEGLSVTLHTSTIVPGFVEVATIFAQQAKEAGVDVQIKKEDPNSYFDTSLLYTKLDFAQSFWTVTSLGQWYEEALLSDAVWNETHWRDPEFDKLIQAAQGATDEQSATDFWHQVQEVQYEDGGYIVWANVNTVDAVANNVQGVEPSAFFNLSGWAYRNFWLDE